ncbi:hypothetical protein [Streptomyces sp. NPDC001508]|uniref:hypothetical protein n=1 Tax=Streptomyces sp. NPDC001508 TaxID=3154656 RepID=UPI00332F6828
MPPTARGGQKGRAWRLGRQARAETPLRIVGPDLTHLVEQAGRAGIAACAPQCANSGRLGPNWAPQ